MRWLKKTSTNTSVQANEAEDVAQEDEQIYILSEADEVAEKEYNHICSGKRAL